MNVKELLQGVDNLVATQIAYIFSCFFKEFDGTRYDERDSIVGIGQPNRHLFCYFKREEDKVLVKFKSETEAVVLPQESTCLTNCIMQTIDLFKNNDFSTVNNKVNNKINHKKTPRERKQIWEERKRVSLLYKMRYKVDLKFCDDIEQLKQECLSNESVFAQKLIELKDLLVKFVEQIIIKEQNKEITKKLLKEKSERKTIRDIGNEYGISGWAVSLKFSKQLKRVTKQLNIGKGENEVLYNLRQEYMESFASFPVDAFMLYLLKINEPFFYKAFIIVFLPFIYQKEELFDFVVQAKRSFNKPKRRTVKHNEFRVSISEDGELLTDINLLEKLKCIRKKMSNAEGVLEKWIFTDKQLVSLATEKPTNRQAFLKLVNSNLDWQNFGDEMLQEIINHTKQ